MAVAQLLVAAAFLHLSHCAAGAAAPPPVPAGAAVVQAAVMSRLAQRAAAASSAATPHVLEAFDDVPFRALLKAALPPGSTTLDPTVPAEELLRRFRAELRWQTHGRALIKKFF